MGELKERRTSDRIALEIPIELVTIPVSISDGAHSSFTKNISCSGLNCKLNQYIPPFTQVEVKLLLPHEKKNKLPHQICFQGTVVRTERVKQKDGNTEYHIAIFVPSGIEFQDEEFTLMLQRNQQTLYSG